MNEEKLRETFAAAFGANIETEDILHALAATLKMKATMMRSHACTAESVAAVEAERIAIQNCAYGLHNQRADAIRRARAAE